MNEIVGRTREQLMLERIYKSQNAEFIIIYGRRRVGKTYLIKKYFAPLPGKFLQITGTQNGLLNEQLSEFAKAIGETFY
ncbi:MAG: AAA family ATPase, partial [Legionellales bacterium]